MGEAAGEEMGECPSEEIGAYLDAELSTERTAALEAHLPHCSICRDELNSQKLFLLELSRSLELEEGIDLPNNFAKAIITKAESTVTGLRKRSERAAAAAIILMLLVLSAAGFAGDWVRVTSEAARPLGVFGALFDVAVGFLQSVLFAATFVLKKAFSGVSGKVMFALVLTVLAAAGFFFLRRSRQATGLVG